MARKILTSSRVPKEGNLHYYHLPKGLLDVTLSSRMYEGSNVFEIEAKERHIPDPDHRYYLRYHANPYTNDKLEIEFHPSGFLKRVSAIIEDKSLEVIDQAIKVGEEVTKALVGTRSVVEKQVLFQAAVDPFDDESMNRLNNHLQRLETGLSVEIAPITNKKDTPDKYEAPRDNDNGIFCRPAEPYEWIIKTQNIEQRSIVMLPHPTIIHFIHLPSTRFVTNEFLIEFDTLGYPMKINLGKPSQALQILEIPIKILNAIVSIPAKIFQFRIDYRSKRQEMLESEQKLNEKIEALERKQEALEKNVDNTKK